VTPGASASVGLTGVQITDDRAGVAGWSAQVALTDLVGVNAANVITATAATYTPEAATVTGTSTVAETPASDLSTAKTVQAATAVSGNNTATWNASLSVLALLRSLMTLFALILLALSAVAPATAADSVGCDTPSPLRPDGIGIRLLDIPAGVQNDPQARTYIVDGLAPGTEINRRVRVENNTRTPQTIRIYPGAAHIDGGAFIGDDASVKNDLTTWTR
jgi:hypothetical protein